MRPFRLVFFRASFELASRSKDKTRGKGAEISLIIRIIEMNITNDGYPVAGDTVLYPSLLHSKWLILRYFEKQEWSARKVPKLLKKRLQTTEKGN